VIKQAELFDIHMSMHHEYISKLQPTICNIYWFIYFYRCSTCFRRFLRPSSGAQKCTIQLSGIVNQYCCLPQQAQVEINKSRNFASCWL